MDSTLTALDAHPAPLDVPGADLDDGRTAEIVLEDMAATTPLMAFPAGADNALSETFDRAILAALVSG
jgi:hypothetical protein